MSAQKKAKTTQALPARPNVAPEGTSTWAREDGYGFATDLYVLFPTTTKI